MVGCGGGEPTTTVCEPSIVFLNRAGGLYDQAPADDASANLSVLLDGPRALPAYPHDDVEWAATTACIRAALAAFPIDVTETDPGAAKHVEIVFTTAYWAGPAGTTMVVPDGCRPGHQLEFVFGNALPTDARACQMALIGFAEMTAQLSIGGDCRDIVDLSQDCVETRSFLDEPVACVDAANQPAPCRCGGGTTQNTFQQLAAAHPPCD